MNEKEWIESVVADRNDLLFFSGCGNLIYKNQCGVNANVPTEITRQDLDQALSLLLKSYEQIDDDNAIGGSSFYGIFHPEMLIDLQNTHGFIPRIDYAYPMNALDHEVGAIGNIRLLSFNNMPKYIHELNTEYDFILIQTKNFLCKTEDFKVPEVINRLIIKSSRYK